MSEHRAVSTPPRRAAITRALFLELVLDLVIFAVCSVICLQVFGAARVESSRSAALSQLGIEAQELAESFKAASGDVAALEAFAGAQRDGNTVVWYYSQDLLPVSSEDAYFVLSCVVDDSKPVKQARISLAEESEELFEYQVNSYRLSGGDGA